jgi:hypothetical protein
MITTFEDVIQKTRGLLRGSQATGPLTGLLAPLDVARVARELDLRTRGEERGRKNLPRSDQTALDEVEQEIVQTVTSTWTLQRDEVIGTLKALGDRIARFNVDVEVAGLRLVAQSIIARFTASRQYIRGELARLKEAATTAARELREFKDANALTRPARPRANLWSAGGVLLVVLVVESVMNGFFFAEGAAMGLLGGTGIAFSISAANVVGCLFLGWGPARYTNIRSIPKRLFAYAICVGAAALIVCLHLFAAHCRAAVALHGEARGYEEAFTVMWQSPLTLPDMKSWYLFFLGLLSACVAVWKGYRQDDPYPHYGAVYRRAHKAEVDYDEAYKSLFDELAEVRDEAIDRFETALKNMPAGAQYAQSAHEQASALVERFAAYEDHLEECCNTLLSVYRDANRSSRATEPPARFDQRWRLTPRTSLSIPNPPRFVASDQRGAQDEITSLHREVLGHYQALLTEADHPESMREKWQ